MLLIVNEVIGRRKNQTILACLSVKTVFLKIVNSKSASESNKHQPEINTPQKKTRRKKES